MGWILPCPRRLVQSSCSSGGCNLHPELSLDRGRSREKRPVVVCLLFLHLSKIPQLGRTAGAPARGHARPTYEPIPPAAHPPYRDGCVATYQQFGTPRLCRGWSYCSNFLAYRLSRPETLHEIKLLLEPAASVVEGSWGKLEVVFSGPNTNPQSQAAS